MTEHHTEEEIGSLAASIPTQEEFMKTFNTQEAKDDLYECVEKFHKVLTAKYVDFDTHSCLFVYTTYNRHVMEWMRSLLKDRGYNHTITTDQSSWVIRATTNSCPLVSSTTGPFSLEL